MDKAESVSASIAQSLPLPVVAQWKRRMQAVEAYVDAVRALDQVSGIFANDSHGLTVYTVYRGDRRQARVAIYDTYQAIMNRFPDVLVDFHTVPSDNADVIPVPETAHRVYPD